MKNSSDYALSLSWLNTIGMLNSFSFVDGTYQVELQYYKNFRILEFDIS